MVTGYIYIYIYVYVGFCVKRDLHVLRINNEKRGDKRFLTFVCEYNTNDACDLCHNCVTTSVHVGASVRCSLDRNLTLFEEVTASYAMESSLRQRGVTLEEVMSLLEAEFDDAESEYQHGRLETHPDEIASEPEENSDDEQKEGEEESGYITEGELVKIESSFEDRTEQV